MGDLVEFIAQNRCAGAAPRVRAGPARPRGHEPGRPAIPRKPSRASAAKRFLDGPACARSRSIFAHRRCAISASSRRTPRRVLREMKERGGLSRLKRLTAEMDNATGSTSSSTKIEAERGADGDFSISASITARASCSASSARGQLSARRRRKSESYACGQLQPPKADPGPRRYRGLL